MPTHIQIADRRVGPGEPLFVIAEIGLNHGGSLDRALRLVDAAAAAGASAVKVQVLRAADLVAPGCPAPAHVRAHSLVEFFAQFELEESGYAAIAERARRRGLAFVATPFALGAVEMLERLAPDAYKIASGDITYDALIEACAGTGRPLVISTGMAVIPEIGHALACAGRRASGAALLHCVSAYPVPRGDENLRAIATLARTFGLPVGLSDHTALASAAPVALALGASLYERHLVLPGDESAVDRAVSSTPEELAAAVRQAEEVARALGSGSKRCMPAELPNRVPSRRALRAARRLSAGDIIRASDVAVLRPADGLSPAYLRDLVGVRLTRDLEPGAPFLPSDLAEPASGGGVDREAA